MSSQRKDPSSTPSTSSSMSTSSVRKAFRLGRWRIFTPSSANHLHVSAAHSAYQQFGHGKTETSSPPQQQQPPPQPPTTPLPAIPAPPTRGLSRSEVTRIQTSPPPPSSSPSSSGESASPHFTAATATTTTASPPPTAPLPATPLTSSSTHHPSIPAAPSPARSSTTVQRTAGQLSADTRRQFEVLEKLAGSDSHGFSTWRAQRGDGDGGDGGDAPVGTVVNAEGDRHGGRGGGDDAADDDAAADDADDDAEEEGTEFLQAQHAQLALTRMHACLLHTQLCDVTLVAGTRRIPAHRLVLSSVSDYFAAMFTGDELEAKQQEVRMEGIEPGTLWSLVQYAYTGRLQVRQESVEVVLAGACMLQLRQLVAVCCGFLSRHLRATNCVGIAAFAGAHGCHGLTAAAHAYALANFVAVSRCGEFVLLPAERLSRLLGSDDLGVDDERAVMDALLAWVMHDPAARAHNLPRLLAHVRLPLLPPQFLADLESNPLLRDDLGCQKLLMEAMTYHLVPERRSGLHSPRTRPRNATVGFLYAVGAVDPSQGDPSVERFDVRADRWCVAGAMSGRRLQFGVAVVAGAVVVVGGRDGLKTLNSAEALRPDTAEWTGLPPMSTHRHGLGVAVLGGPLYAVGGHDGWSYLCSVERWDPLAAGAGWSFVAPLAGARSTAGVTVMRGKLFAVGGRDGASCLRSVESYDPHSDRWSARAPLCVERGGPGVAACDGCIYAVGGHNNPTPSHGAHILACVERYDPQTDAWSVVSGLSSPRDAVGLALLGHRLYAVGGHDGTSALRSVEAYEPLTDTWTKVASLCSPRAGACVVVVKPS